jgi:methylisocitrate lyase
MDAAIARARACVDAGADMVFPEALHSLAQYRQFAAAVPVPVLANITEFGATPLFTCAELADAGIGLVLYPLTAFRAMNSAALTVYRHLLAEGGQQALIGRLQTREELYQLLNYHEYERKLDELFKP